VFCSFSRSVRAVGLVAFCLVIAPRAHGQSTSIAGSAPGKLLVGFRQGVSPEQARGILRSLAVTTESELPGIGVHVVQLPQNASETAFRNALQRLPDVEFAEPDYLRIPGQTPPSMTPNDPNYSGQWHLPKISAPTAWPVTTGDPGIIIAIADTGVDSTHPDLLPNIVPGWNVADNNSNTADVHGHGTQVAGSAAAAGNNLIGVAGVAWRCRIMPIRVSGLNGSAYDSAIAKGIIWAADHGARVVNASYDVTASATVSSAARYMNTKSGVVTISAGNYSTFDNISNDPAMITVGATDPNDVKYSWSDYGTDIDVVAPGCVVTTYRGGGYGSACGTSFSAPVTAGVAALIMSAKPTLSPSQVLGILQSSADDLGTAGWDTTFGSGRVNAYKAVTAAAGAATDTQLPIVSFVNPGAGATVSGTVSVQVSASDNVGVTSISVTANGTLIGSSSSFSWNTAGRPNGAYTLTAVAKDAAGNSSSSSRAVTVSNISDATPPTVAISSPVAGALLSGMVTLAVNATDNVGVVRVEYWADGALIGTSTNAPFNFKWNIRKVNTGAHTLQAKAYDARGNIGVSPIVSVNVTR
jgi:thermitase